jgi:transposase
VTETCEADRPNLITDVQTTAAGTPDGAVTAPVQSALAARGLLPETHVVDAGYVDAALLVASQVDHAIDLLGPVALDHGWRAHSEQGFDLSAFTIVWPDRVAHCPAGQTSRDWSETCDKRGTPLVHITFAPTTCAACPNRPLCTPSPPGKRSRPRSLVVRRQPEHEALQARRVEQKSEIWKKRYSCRAGIEGTLSQGIRGFGLRRCRYVGHAKTHLQHLFTAAAINLARLDAWLQGNLRAQTRQSKLTALVPNAA